MSRTIRRRLPDHAGSALATEVAPTSTETLAAAIDAGDTLATEVIDEAADLLGTAIANWVTFLAIDTVLVGGGVTETLGPPYLTRIRAALDREVFPPRNRVCELRMTELRENAGLLGAALLAMEKAGARSQKQ